MRPYDFQLDMKVRMPYVNIPEADPSDVVDEGGCGNPPSRRLPRGTTMRRRPGRRAVAAAAADDDDDENESDDNARTHRDDGILPLPSDGNG
jgi:hypothetical protein